MSSASSTRPSIVDLQQRVHRMQGAAVSRSLPLLPALAGAVELRTGTVCGVDNLGLAMALMAGPSQAGEWAAVVGAPDFGFEAAAGVGVELGRIIAVPAPGEHWLSVTAGLIDMATVIVVRPPTRITAHQAERLRSRLRQKDAVLIACGDWPRCQWRLSATGSRWLGLGRGHGHLTARQLQLTVTSGALPARSLHLWLPGPDQRVSRAEPVPAEILTAVG